MEDTKTINEIKVLLNQLIEDVQALTEQQAEIVEKLANISLGGEGFSITAGYDD